MRRAHDKACARNRGGDSKLLSQCGLVGAHTVCRVGDRRAMQQEKDEAHVYRKIIQLPLEPPPLFAAGKKRGIAVKRDELQLASQRDAVPAPAAFLGKSLPPICQTVGLHASLEFVVAEHGVHAQLLAPPGSGLPREDLIIDPVAAMPKDIASEKHRIGFLASNACHKEAARARQAGLRLAEISKPHVAINDKPERWLQVSIHDRECRWR